MKSLNQIQGTYIFYMNVAPLKNGEIFEKCCKSLPKWRLNKINSLHFLKDKILSMTAWICLCEGFKKFGLNVDDYEVEIDSNGKPRFVDFPYRFNISHSGDYVVVAISNDEVGCDIESIENKNPSLAKRFFSEDEVQFIESSNDVNKEFVRIWTLKESYIKAIGLGLKKDLRSFSVLKDLGYFLLSFDTIPGYIFSIASKEQLIKEPFHIDEVK